MVQYGFFHPSSGYWETTGWPSDEYQLDYPSGWRQVSPKPGENFHFDPDTDTWSPNPRAISRDEVNIERDRRNFLDIVFQGVNFQADQVSRGRIGHVVTSAIAAIMAGAQVGDLSWHGQTDDFAWIAKDNTKVPMDAQTLLSLSQVMAERERRLVVAANSIKAMDPIPTDFNTNERYWP
ncbi:hypothetical protein IWQ54_003313 [Labrenzia sp. EL_195]|nr:hypothetical protein [Labrenzia sp. EL_195]